MSDIFKEVDDALKQDKVEEFWKTHGNFIITLILLVIAGTGAYSGYNAWMHARQETQTAVLLELAKDPDTFDSEKLSSLTANQNAVAQLMQARVALTKEEFEAAFDTYKSVAGDLTTDKEMRGLAAYYARNMILNDQIEATLSDVTLPDDSIWQGHYRLQNALNLGSKQQKYTQALQILDELILDDATPTSLVQQAKQLKYVYDHDMKEGK